MSKKKKDVWFDSSRTYSNWSSDLDARMSQLYEQYGKTDFWKEFLANPYLNFSRSPKNPSANNDFWMTMRDTYGLEANKYISEIIQKIREQSYNEPVSQVERERVAGINSDLAGNVAPNDATEGTELPSPDLPSPFEQTAQQLEMGNSIASAGMQFLQTILGMAGSMQSLTAGSLQNAYSELALYSGAENWLTDFTVNRMPVPSKDEEEHKKSFGDLFKDTLDSSLVEGNFKFSPRTRKALRLVAAGLKSGLTGTGSLGVANKYEDLAMKFLTGRTNRAKSMSSPLYDDDFLDMMSKFSKDYSQLSYDVWKAQNEASKVIAEYNQKFYHTLNRLGVAGSSADLQNLLTQNGVALQAKLKELGVPQDSAELQDLQVQAQKAQTDVNRMRTEAIQRAEAEFEKIQRQYLSGDKWYHVLGRLALPVLRDLVSRSVGGFFDSAASSIAAHVFNPTPPTQHNTSIVDNSSHSTWNY